MTDGPNRSLDPNALGSYTRCVVYMSDYFYFKDILGK